MTTLEEAWAWYSAAVSGARRLAHLAKHWDDFPWEADAGWVRTVARDNALRAVGGAELARDAELVRSELDDLAVLVLFSVFEANVRDLVVTRVRPEAARITEPTLRKAAEDVIELIEKGSFARLLEPYKTVASPDLIEQIDQVRNYRNWVSHGRRPSSKINARVEPRLAYERLRAFLDVLRGPTPDTAAPLAAPPA
jgi:hypothetical protein